MYIYIYIYIYVYIYIYIYDYFTPIDIYIYIYIHTHNAYCRLLCIYFMRIHKYHQIYMNIHKFIYEHEPYGKYHQTHHQMASTILQTYTSTIRYI